MIKIGEGARTEEPKSSLGKIHSFNCCSISLLAEESDSQRKLTQVLLSQNVQLLNREQKMKEVMSSFINGANKLRQ